MFLSIPPADEPLAEKLWQKHLDIFLKTGRLNPEILEYLNPAQQWCVYEIHKSFKRIDRREKKKEVEDANI